MLMIALATLAMPVFNVPTFRIQPNGDTLHCFVSGDEYYNRLHDSAGYTIVHNPQNGWWVYADTLHTDMEHWQLVPTDYVAGRINPHTVARLVPNLGVDRDTWLKKQHFEENIDAPKTSGANHGRLNNLVIFIRFSDQGEMATSLNTIDAMLNDSSETANSMYNYFKQVSYNKLSIVSHYYPAPSNDTIISYQDIYPRDYYTPFSYQSDYERRYREQSLLERAVNYVVANSPVPTDLDIDMDNDGKVDNVCFVVDGWCFAWGELLWPHKGTLNDRYVYINGKRVWNYTIMLSGAGSTYFNTSVFCHEMFHTLGAPDLYRYNNTTLDPSDYPVGQWDLMGTNSNPPQHMSAYMKWKYGNWLDSIPTITHPGTYTLHSLGDSTYDNCCYKIATLHPNQWYVLEYRDNTELFETTLPGKGLLIYRIDTRYTGNSGNHDEVYLFRPSTSDHVPTIPLGMAYFSGSTSRNAFTPQTNPFPTFADDIVDSAFAIIDISVPDSTISFTYAPVCVTPHGLSTSNITDTSARLSWQTGADSVLLQWRSVNAPDTNSVVLGGQSLMLDTLLPATGYEWRVKSICGIGDSSWFTPWNTFSTTQCLLQETTVGIGETSSFTFPFNTWYKYSYSQMLYTAAEIGEAREITTLSFNYTAWNRPIVNKDSCVIYLGTTTDTTFDDYHAPFMPFNRLHKVYEGPLTFDYGWNNIELDRSFYYNGTETLIVAIDDNSGTENTSNHRFACTNTPGRYSSMACYDDNINFDPTQSYLPYHEARQFRADIRFIGCSLPDMPVFQVNVLSSDSTLGSVTGGGTYESYSFATLTAIPVANYHFAYWLSGSDTITDNPYTFSVSADSTIVAYFAIDSFEVNLSANGGGTVSGGGMYPIGGTATITATASDNHHFLYWIGNDDTITYNPCTFTVTSDTVVTAHFAIDSHYVSVLPSDSTIGFAYLFGIDGELLNSALLPYGYLVDIYATPNQNMDGYQCTFLQWSDGNTEHRRLITLTQDTVLVAMFEAQPLEGIPTAIDSFTMAVRANGIEVVGAAGQVVILCDVMGRTLWRSVAGQRQFIPVSHAGLYLLRVGDQAARKVIFR